MKLSAHMFAASLAFGSVANGLNGSPPPIKGDEAGHVAMGDFDGFGSMSSADADTSGSSIAGLFNSFSFSERVKSQRGVVSPSLRNGKTDAAGVTGDVDVIGDVTDVDVDASGSSNVGRSDLVSLIVFENDPDGDGFQQRLSKTHPITQVRKPNGMRSSKAKGWNGLRANISSSNKDNDSVDGIGDVGVLRKQGGAEAEGSMIGDETLLEASTKGPKAMDAKNEIGEGLASEYSPQDLTTARVLFKRSHRSDDFSTIDQVVVSSDDGKMANRVLLSGCHETYIGGKSYRFGNQVSATVTKKSNPVYTRNPTTGGWDAKTSETTKTNNYKCISRDGYCGSASYGPGTTWESQAWTREGAECSKTIAVVGSTTPKLWSGAGCPSVYKGNVGYDAGDVVSYKKLVYQCNGEPLNQFCGMTGYEPLVGQYYAVAWKVLGSCLGTLSPTSSPNFVSLKDLGGCPDKWSAKAVGKEYSEGDQVSVENLVLQCKPWPHSAHCSQAGYKPMSDPATPGAWKDAWSVVGHCDGSLGPTSSPVFDTLKKIGNGCPPEYSQYKLDYNAGDQVALTMSMNSNSSIVYECLSWPNSGYCNHGSYAPGSQYGHMAWLKAGFCVGTTSPTPSPTAFYPDLSCKYSKCKNQETPCTCGTSGCPAINKQATNCKMMNRTCVDTVIVPYSNGAVYTTGDIVRVGAKRFKCKSFPYSGWCSISAYAPELKPGIWSDAWEMDGSCKPLTVVYTTTTTTVTIPVVSTITLSNFVLPVNEQERQATLLVLANSIKSILQKSWLQGQKVDDVVIISVNGVSVVRRLLFEVSHERLLGGETEVVWKALVQQTTTVIGDNKGNLIVGDKNATVEVINTTATVANIAKAMDAAVSGENSALTQILQVEAEKVNVTAFVGTTAKSETDLNQVVRTTTTTTTTASQGYVTESPTGSPSKKPSLSPTTSLSPTVSGQPSEYPSASSRPTSQPSEMPSSVPSEHPSSQPSSVPSGQPSSQPSFVPSGQPSSKPSEMPSSVPSGQPSSQPSSVPSGQPSSKPSEMPSGQPSSQPSSVPSGQPSSQPSDMPSSVPSEQPSGQPSSKPSEMPSGQPSSQPSSVPSGQPSSQPSSVPSGQPSSQPSSVPSGQPSSQPSSRTP